MRKYCKAYHLREFRRFSGWMEQHASGDVELTDDTIVYLWDDFTVVASPIHHQTLLFANVTPQWQDFCTSTLQFAIPDDLQYAYAQQNDATA